MEPCIAYSELVEALETSIIILKENLQGETPETPADRLEWLLKRHNTAGADGCDWCVLAEEIRRLRAGLRGDIVDPGTVRLGSGCITAAFPPFKKKIWKR